MRRRGKVFLSQLRASWLIFLLCCCLLAVKDWNNFYYLFFIFSLLLPRFARHIQTKHPKNVHTFDKCRVRVWGSGMVEYEGKKGEIYENVNSHRFSGDTIMEYKFANYSNCNEIFLFSHTDLCQLMLYFSETHKPQLRDKIRMHRLERYQRLWHQCGTYYNRIIRTWVYVTRERTFSCRKKEGKRKKLSSLIIARYRTKMTFFELEIVNSFYAFWWNDTSCFNDMHRMIKFPYMKIQ